MENIQTVNNEMRVKQASGDESLLAGYEFRCPQCSKLYRVKKKDLISSSPQFECNTCHTVFNVNFRFQKATVALPTSSLSPMQMLKLEEKQKANQLRRSAVQKGSLKSCSKCKALNPRVAQDCYKCGLVFEKADLMNEAQKQGGVPSLMKMWQELMQDYDNMAKHMAFVDRCEDLQALPFALKKYKGLKEVQPQDSTAEKMFKSVIIKSITSRAQFVTNHAWYQKWLLPIQLKTQGIPWLNLIRISPLVLSILLILVGLSNSANRNFAGGGVALSVLTLGFAYVLKGRLKWQDFWY